MTEPAMPDRSTGTADDVAAVCALKYRYLRTLDLKDWDAFGACFTDDATARYSDGKYEFAGRDAIVGFMREQLGPSMITMHQCHHPEIAIEGDRATGRWSLQDMVLMTEHRLLLQGASFYDDVSVRGDDGRWRIAHTGYVRTFEYMISLDDLPSFNLLQNRWA